MSFNKFRNNSYCVGGKHYSTITNIRGDITVNKKTSMSVKLITLLFLTLLNTKVLTLTIVLLHLLSLLLL